MPWTPEDADKHIKGLDDKSKRQWAHIANSALSACLKDGGSQKDCEAKAIIEASGAVQKSDIVKMDTDQRRVFGWSSVSVSSAGQVEDLHGDVIDPQDFEEAMYDFSKSCRLAGEMHEGEACGEMIEGMCFTPEKTYAMFRDILGEEVAKHVAEKIGVRAFHGFEFTPEAFAKVKSGAYRMFSIQGTAERIPHGL